jgi:DNA mismatch endonuclease (patch repair protein)
VPPKSYLRDGRAPVPTDARTSATMSRIRAKHTGPELAVRRALRAQGLTGYRLHYAKAPGKPDIAFVGRKVAVFVHGCFWHGCPHCQPRRPKTHKSFWNAKLDRNMERDAEKAKALKQAGWRVITLWECRVKQDVGKEVGRVVAKCKVRSSNCEV